MNATEDLTRRAGAPDAPADVPTLTVAELEADPHGVFRACRPRLPFVGHEVAGFLILRARDVDLLMRDPRAQATETLCPESRAIPAGALFDIFAHGMLTASGAVLFGPAVWWYD